MTRMPMPFNNPATYKGHGGVDFAQPYLTPIPAITDGKITFNGWWNDRAGWTKTLTRDGGLQIMYCHLPDRSGAQAGTHVRVGQIIARVGYSGHVVPPGVGGSHLHLEMWLRSKPQDEWLWMDPNNWVGKGSGAGGGGQPLPPVVVPIVEEDDEMDIGYIRTGPQATVWAVHPWLLTRKSLTPAAWAAAQTAGATVAQVTQARLDGIPVAK